MVVVAAPWLQKYSSFHYQSGEQPLLLPIRSLKSRLSEEDIDVQSLNMSMSSKRFSSYSNRKAEVEAVDVDVQYLNRSTTFMFMCVILVFVPMCTILIIFMYIIQ